MKKINSLPRCLLLCLITGGAFQVFGQANQLTVIFDGRPNEEIATNVTETDKQFIEKEVRKQESVIKAKSNLECNDDDDTFSVLNAVSGSFTQAKAVQKAYLYELCRSARSYGIGGIIIVESGKVVAHHTYGESGLDYDIQLLPDINQNGLDELLLVGGGMGQGFTMGAVEIAELTASGVQTFGIADTYSDDYGANEKGSATAYRISVQKGKIPVYFRETYRQMREEGKWILSKKSQKFALREGVSKFNKIL
jgi:hypothetical protein